MQDNYLDDVTPPVHKRTIRDIPIPAHRQRKHLRKKTDVIVRRRVVDENDSGIDMDSESKQIRRNREEHRPGLNKIKFIYGPLAIFAVILVITGLNMFSKANVEILTKTESLANLNTNFNISTIEDLDGDEDIPYQKINLQKTSSMIVAASGEEFVEQKASGIITIHNEYSSTAQTLVEKTRFQSPDGKIYRIAKNITVPGYTGSGDEIKAGIIDAEVFADESGEDYNFDSLNTRFNIPGFEGQDQYDVFYAQLKKPITGGFNGIKKIVSEDDLNIAKEKLQSDIKELLEREIENQLPENLLAIYNKSSFEFGEVTQNDEASGDTSLEMSGNLSLVAFDKETLAEKIAEDQLNDYRSGEEIEITNLDDLLINLNIDSERISVSGDINFKWKNDIEKLKEDLAGAKENSLRDIFGKYRGIVSVNTKISPIWKNEFPKNPKRIYISEK